MTCNECTDRFSDYLDGQMQSSLRRQFEAHLQPCPACASQLRGLRELRNRLGRLPNKRLPDAFSFTVRRMLLEEAQREESLAYRFRKAVSPRPQIAWAATIGTLAAAMSFALFWAAWAPSPVVPAAGTPSIAAGTQTDNRRAVRYVLENIPLEGDLIEATAEDTVHRSLPKSIRQVGAHTVSANF